MTLSESLYLKKKKNFNFHTRCTSKNVLIRIGKLHYCFQSMGRFAVRGHTACRHRHADPLLLRLFCLCLCVPRVLVRFLKSIRSIFNYFPFQLGLYFCSDRQLHSPWSARLCADSNNSNHCCFQGKHRPSLLSMKFPFNSGNSNLAELFSRQHGPIVHHFCFPPVCRSV